MEEPTDTPAARAAFIVARISAAMQDLSASYPPLPGPPPAWERTSNRRPSRAGVWVNGSYCALGGWRWKIIPAHYEPAAEVVWSLNFPKHRAASLRLAGAISLYADGKVSADLVKRYYRRFAAAHMLYWVEGRSFYDERAARLAVEESYAHLGIPETAPHPAPLASPSLREAKPAARPRLAYSRGRAQRHD